MKRWINHYPSTPLRAFLGVLPFVIALVLYQWGSEVRKAGNPRDKLLPSFGEVQTAMHELVFTPSTRTGEYLFWEDTRSSLKRLLGAMVVVALAGLVIGLLTGAIPLFDAPLTPLVTAVSLIPPMAVLPILFIVFGLGELSKVMLIVIGVTPILIRDLHQRTQQLPAEQRVKALTLGGNSFQIIWRVMLPQVLPRLLDAVRLTLGTAWLFLIAAEAIAADSGLGYRIFLMRRYLAMDVILPYVAWITLLAFITDWLLLQLNRGLFPWYHTVRANPR